MRTSITVDGGGSGCRARLRKDTESFEAALNLPANLASQPLNKVLERLDLLFDRLPAVDHVNSVNVGLAGGVPGERRDAVETAVKRRYPEAAVVIGRDLDLVVAHLGGEGVAVVVGTGCAAVATAREGTQVTVDGHGLAIGDRGGAAWIGLKAVQVGLRRLDLEGVETPLLLAVRQSLGLPGNRGFFTVLAGDSGLSAERLAALAPKVLELVDQAEPDASAIVTAAVAEVEEAVGAVARAARLTLPTKVVVAGGLSKAPQLMTPLRDDLLGNGVAKAVDRVDPLDAKLAGWHAT
jgi:glucosamine kinase